MEALNAMMQRLGRTDPRLAEEMRLQQEENRRRDEETRLRSHFGAAGRPTGAPAPPAPQENRGGLVAQLTAMLLHGDRAPPASASAGYGAGAGAGAASRGGVLPHPRDPAGAGALPPGRRSGTGDSLATSDISLVSHVHGRERRAERHIERRELQEALRYGRKELANPGRDGAKRWRVIFKGVTFITDETCRHEITSWRMDEAEDLVPVAEEANSQGGAHTVLVVDQSGSMRKDDIHGYKSRTEAVYDTVARDFVAERVKEQEELGRDQLGAAGSGEVLTLIEFSDQATVVFERRPIGRDLLGVLKKRGERRAASHGNYIPALQRVQEVLGREQSASAQLLVVFLSDGAPSDHIERACLHGFQVWQDDVNGPIKPNGKSALINCPLAPGGQCRTAVQKAVKEDCTTLVRTLGDLFGRDRLYLTTVAFGPPTENFQVLQDMAAVLPRSSFQKLGLSANSLRTAFSSISSTLSTMTSESAGTSLIHRRIVVDKTTARNERKWDVYLSSEGNFVSKKRWSLAEKRFLAVLMPLGVDGVGHALGTIGKGVDRIVHHAAEMGLDKQGVIFEMGEQLVAKETAHEVFMKDKEFHTNFCRCQGQAQALADNFNRRVRGGPNLQINFLSCCVYTVKDDRWPGGEAQFLAEPFLEGEFIKFNNNGGAVNKWGAARPVSALQRPPAVQAAGARVDLDEIGEEDEEEEAGSAAAQRAAMGADDIPQCFSHFTHFFTSGDKLVCDLQGIYNDVDGFVLTDPVIHESRKRGKNGRTDKGARGIDLFFETHRCNALCRSLGLPPPVAGQPPGIPQR